MGAEQNKQNVARFDQWARSYDRGRMTPWFTRGQAKILEAFGLEEDDRLLDIGCGTGWAVIRAAQTVPSGGACGIDLSPGMISRATDLADGLSNVEFRVADAESVPYPDESFNAVMCTNSFHHYANPARALSEMRRVLKPGGQLIIGDSDRGACLWVRLWDMVNRVFEKGHVRYHTVEELRQLLHEAGIERSELIASEHCHFQKGKLASATYVVRAVEEKS